MFFGFFRLGRELRLGLGAPPWSAGVLAGWSASVSLAAGKSNWMPARGRRTGRRDAGAPWTATRERSGVRPRARPFVPRSTFKVLHSVFCIQATLTLFCHSSFSICHLSFPAFPVLPAALRSQSPHPAPQKTFPCDIAYMGACRNARATCPPSPRISTE